MTPGVSTLKLYAIAFVVGAVVWRSAQALAAPGYPWHAVHASLLAGGGGTGGAGAGWGGLAVALPLLAFGFQVRQLLAARLGWQVDWPRVAAPGSAHEPNRCACSAQNSSQASSCLPPRSLLVRAVPHRGGRFVL